MGGGRLEPELVADRLQPDADGIMGPDQPDDGRHLAHALDPTHRAARAVLGRLLGGAHPIWLPAPCADSNI